MALLKGICHPILLTGNLKNSNFLELKLPYNDISSNVWQISLNQIAQSFNVPSNTLCGIGCNFVTDVKFNTENQVVTYCPILWQCLFKGQKNEKSVKSFEQNWFYVTTTQQEIKLQFYSYFQGSVTNDLLNLDCDLYVSVLLQRVK